MLPSRDWVRDERGSAALEFITVGVILLVPLVYLVIALGVIQEHLLGVEAAARHTARVIGTAEGPEGAAARGDAVVANVIREYGMDADSVEIRITCARSPRECPAPGETVLVHVSAHVELPFVPPVLGLDALATIPLEATASQRTSRAWGTG